MAEITVRVLGEEEWQTYREVRLRALADTPGAFVADQDTEAGYDEERWRDRMSRSARMVAERDGQVLGVVSVREDGKLFESSAELFGLWVDQEVRGGGVANQLVQAAAQLAVSHGLRQLFCWVGTDNARAVAFNSSYGFRPTEYRRTVEEHPQAADAGPATPSWDDGPEEELVMVLALRT